MAKSITKRIKKKSARNKSGKDKNKKNTKKLKQPRFSSRVAYRLGECKDCEEEKNFEVVVTPMAGDSIILYSEPGDTIFDIKKAVASVLDTGTDNTFLINMEDPDHPLRDEDVIQSNLMLMVSIVDMYALVLYIDSSRHARYIYPIYIAKSQEEAIKAFRELHNKVDYQTEERPQEHDITSDKGLLDIIGEGGKRLKSTKLGHFLKSRSGARYFQINGQYINLPRIEDINPEKVYFLVVPFSSDTEIEKKIHDLSLHST